MKKLTINQIIDIKLQEWGRVDLRGIGTLKLLYDTAVIDWAESVIKPPAALIVFSESDQVEPQFAIHSHGLLNEYELDYNTYLAEFYDEIDKLGCRIIENLGRFDKTGEDKVHFSQDPHSSHVQSFSMKATYPISISSQPSEAKPLSVQPKSPSRGFGKRMLLRLGFALAFLLLALIIYNQYNLLRFNKTFVSIPEDRVNVKPESLVLSDTYIQDSSESLDFDITPEPEMDEIEDLSASPPDNLELDLKTSQTKDCLIVVGAFGVNDNVHRMLEFLRKEGFEAGTNAGSGLTRVGIKVSCDDFSDLLSRIRSEIEPNAWILGN